MIGGATVYAGFDGDAMITGSDVRILVQGADVEVSVTGTGRYRLVGVGSFTAEGTVRPDTGSQPRSRGDASCLLRRTTARGLALGWGPGSVRPLTAYEHRKESDRADSAAPAYADRL